MRALLILTLIAAGLAQTARADYREERELTLAAAAADSLRIDAAAGSLKVVGSDNGDAVRVVAAIVVPDVSDDKARKILASALRLSLEEDAGQLLLQSGFQGGGSWFRDSPRIDLEVTMPRRLALVIDDSSGSIDVEGIDGAVEIDDSSGSISVRKLGDGLRIDDSSGSIDVAEVTGAVYIDDGSGSIRVRDVRGGVTIDDGSGSIGVHDISEDLVILDDGSGSLRVSGIGGKVDNRS